MIEWIDARLIKLVTKLIGNGHGKKADVICQSIKFGIVGLSNTTLAYLLYAVSLYVLQINSWLMSWDYLAAQTIAFVISVYWSFFWNDKLVFVQKGNSQRNRFQAVLRTYISYSFTGLFLNGLLLVLWIDVVGLDEYYAPLINLLVTVPLNFILNKYWAFKS